MMSFQMKSPCRRVDIYQVSPFPTFLLSRVYQLVSKPFPLQLCVCVSFESFRRRARWWFLFVRSFHIIADLSSAAVGEVMLKFDSTPSIAYPLSPNYSNPCILTSRIPDSCSSSWPVTKKLTTNTLSNGWLTHYPQANALSNHRVVACVAWPKRS